MFGMFKRNAVPADLSKLTVKDIEVLLKKESPQEAGAVLRRAAKEGSTDAAVFLSTMLDRAIQVKGKEHTPKQMLDEYVLFTEMAANRGDLGSQFNIAKHYVFAFDEGMTLRWTRRATKLSRRQRLGTGSPPSRALNHLFKH